MSGIMRKKRELTRLNVRGQGDSLQELNKLEQTRVVFSFAEIASFDDQKRTGMGYRYQHLPPARYYLPEPGPLPNSAWKHRELVRAPGVV